MTNVIVMLFCFITIGLFSHRLGKYTYLAMWLVIVAYVSIAYLTNALSPS